MTQNLIPLAQPANTPLTMSSREIAELVEARHNDVIATIERLFGKGLLRSSRKTRRESTGGRPIDVYDLVERDTYLVVAGYSDEYRAKVVDRWQELEAKATQPQPTVALPHDYITALEHLLESKKAEQLAIAQRDEAIRTKAQIGDRKTATAMATASAATKKAAKLEIELDRSRQYATVKRMEMLYHGQSFNWRLLKSASADVGVPPVDVFDANYGKVKAYHADAWMEAYALPIVANDLVALEQ